MSQGRYSLAIVWQHFPSHVAESPEHSSNSPERSSDSPEGDSGSQVHPGEVDEHSVDLTTHSRCGLRTSMGLSPGRVSFRQR